MAFAPTTSWRFLLSFLLTLVMANASLVAFADSTLVIRPMASVKAEADERVKIQAQVDTTTTHPLAFVWEQKYGEPLSLRNDMTDTVSFIAPRVATPTNYQLMVLVSDGTTQAHSDVTVTVMPYQAQLPIANAGIDQNVESGDLVHLDANLSSDEDSLALTYLWQQSQGQTVVFAPTHAEIDFIAPMVATATALEFQLSVSDERNTSVDKVKVIVSPSATKPLAVPSTTPALQLVPADAASGQVIQPQSDLTRLALVQEAYKACFPGVALSKSKENSLIQSILATNSQSAVNVGMSKIEMLHDVLVVCDLLPMLTAGVSDVAHYVDIPTDSPVWWKSYTNFAYDQKLFDDQPLFLPMKTMQKADLINLLMKVKVIKSPVPVINASPIATIVPSAVIEPAVAPTIVPVVADQSASASVLNKVLAPKFAVFAILFLVGLFCIVYSLLYSLKPARSKATYISLPNVSSHDRR